MNAEKKYIQIVAVSRPTVPATGHGVPLGDSIIPAGFPSPADEFHETFDIVSHIVRHPTATFFMSLLCVLPVNLLISICLQTENL